MDPQILHGPGYEFYLRRLDWWEPNTVDVLEIDHFEGSEPVTKSSSVGSEYLQKWLERAVEVPTSYRGREAVGGLRLMKVNFESLIISANYNHSLGSSTEHISSEELPASYPHGMKDILDQKPLPFSRHNLENIVEKFHLPIVTPWVLTTKSSHFQRHSMSDGARSAFVGYTMRRSSRGILAMNISLSLSHDLDTGMTYGLVFGCSDIQQAFILEQIKSLAHIAVHPLLLPVLFSAHQQQLLNRERKRLWVSLLTVETESGQTGAPVISSNAYQKESQDYGHITKSVLGVIQIASAWESYSKALILGVDSIQESLSHLTEVTPEPRKGAVASVAAIFREWMTSIHHRSNVMLWDFEFIDKRAQAQMTAVHSYIAQRDAQLSQKLSEYSTLLAADSREIAAASKRDSTAMKGIAFLTMVFLPGTYIATFFAMPLLDFSTSTPTSKPGFWIYWAVTAPLTISVLAIYLTYLMRVSRKNREEDRKARDATPVAKTSATYHTTNKETLALREDNGFLARIFEAVLRMNFPKLARKSESNPELGIASKGKTTQLSKISGLVDTSDNGHCVPFETLPTSGNDSLSERPAVEMTVTASNLHADGHGLEKRPRIRRPNVVQTQPIRLFLESDMNSDAKDTDFCRETRHFLPPEASGSRIASNQAPHVNIDNMSIRTNPSGRNHYSAGGGSDVDSDSSCGL